MCLTFLGFALLRKSKPKVVKFDHVKNKYKPNIGYALNRNKAKPML